MLAFARLWNTCSTESFAVTSNGLLGTVAVLWRFDDRIDQLVMGKSIALGNRDAAQSLRSLMPQSLDCKLHVRLAKQRIFFSSVQLYRVIGSIAGRGSEAAHVPDVQLLRLPRLEALCDLLRKTLRIARRAERLF